MRTHQSLRNKTTETFTGGRPVGPWVGWSTFPIVRGSGPRAIDQRTYLSSLHGTPLQGASRCEPSRCIGPYQLEGKLGEGGGSIVYAACSQEDRRRVAIKVPKGGSGIAGQRIKADFRATRRLRHRHVVRMHRLLPVGDRYAAVMEWLAGPSLMESVRGTLPPGQLPPLPRLRSVVAQLAAGLAHIHAAGWVHGDIKPDNVHFTAGGAPRWLDFDLSTSVNRPLWMPPLEHVVGTFSYLPPEAIVGQPAAAPADMFSFGRLLSKLICGRLPSWDPGMGAAVSAARIRQQLPADTPRELLALCTQLVHVSPVARLTAEEVYHQVCGSPLSLPLGTRPPAPVPPHVSAAAGQSLRRADRGKGTLLVIETAEPERFNCEALLAATRADEPRLFLDGHCDRCEEIPYRGFDAILDQLALWIEQVPESLRTEWRQAAGAELALLSPRLAAALQTAAPQIAALQIAAPQITDGHPAAERRDRSGEGCEAVVRLLTAIAQERTVVLSLHNLQELDDDSQRLLIRLVQQMPSVPLVILGTADRRAARMEYASNLSPATKDPLPVTLRVGC